MLRANSVLQARIRIAQHQELQVRESAHLLRDCAFLHLRKDVEATVQHVPTQQPGAFNATSAPARTQTEYGIDKRIQQALSHLRTDLDSFSDREALTLMYSGYRMACQYVDPLAGGRPIIKVDWPFEHVAQVAAGTDQLNVTVDSLLKHLRVGSNIAFKVWLLHPLLRAIALALGVAALLGVLGGLLYLVLTDIQLGVVFHLHAISKSILYTLGLLLAGALFPLAKAWISRARPLFNPGSALNQLTFGLVMACAGFALCRIHLWVFNRLFLYIGRIKAPSHQSSLAGHSPTSSDPRTATTP
jgi:hypothetical protein